jgi:hypothetical protein
MKTAPRLTFFAIAACSLFLPPASVTAATVNFTNGTRASLTSRNFLNPLTRDSDSITPTTYPATGSLSVDSGVVGSGSQNYRFDNSYIGSDAIIGLDFDFTQGGARGDDVQNSFNAFFTVDEETTYRIDGSMTVSGVAGPDPSSSGFQIELRESGSFLYLFGDAVSQPNGTLTINDTNGTTGSRTGVLLPGKSYTLLASASSTSFGQATLANGNYSLTLGAVAIPEPSCLFPFMVLALGLVMTRSRRPRH